MSYTNSSKPIVLAHRGGAGEAPENTLQAFRNAYAQGCRYLETDVRTDKDGELFLCHAASSLVPNRPLRTGGKSYDTLRTLFEDFPDAYVSIDPKHGLAVEPLAQLIAASGRADAVCVGSSVESRAARVVDRVTELCGTRPALAIVGAVSLANLLLGRTAALRKHNAQFIHVPARLVTKRTVRIAHAADLRVISWTLNNQATMRKQLALGIDGYMTDYPSRAET